MVEMDSQTQLKVDIIAKVSDGKMRVSCAQKLLNKSRRTVERYVQKYQKKGIQFAIHENTYRSPHNKTPNKLKKRIQKLIKEKYFDFNLTHLQEKLERCENIYVNRESLRRWAHEIHLVKRAKKRRGRIRKRRERMPSPGLLLQMDGSTHNWFGDSKACLISIIDDANSEIHGEFFPSETTIGCMKVIQDVVSKKGVFKTLYVDKAGVFSGPKRCNFSQVSRACKEMGIEIIFANSPEGKGRIERSFDTFQDRLVPELRINNITQRDKANHYLQKTFIPNYWNKRLIVEPENLKSEYRPVPTGLSLDEIFVIKEYRKVRKDHTFSYSGKIYRIDSSLKASIASRQVEVRTQLSGPFQFYFAGEKLCVSEVIEPRRPCFSDIEIQDQLDAIKLADKLGNVSEAAKQMRVSRQSIYRNRKILNEQGLSVLKKTLKKDDRYSSSFKSVEDQIIGFSLENPHLGEAQVSIQLNKELKIEVSRGSVRNIWLRYGIQTIALRIQKSRLQSSGRTGSLVARSALRAFKKVS